MCIWADPATLAVVRILARRLEEAPLALVLTLRDDELAANPQLGVLLGDLATDSRVKRLVPRPLSVDAVRMLAAEGRADVAEVARVTGGNPFLVVEMLAAGGLVDLAAVVASVCLLSCWTNWRRDRMERSRRPWRARF
jgi:hypothetical protein